MTALAPNRLMRARQDNPAASTELGQVIGGIDEMRKWLDVIALKDLPIFRLGAPYFFDWLEHPAYDAYWRKHRYRGPSTSAIDVPALNIGGWYDIFLGGTLRNYIGMGARGATPHARAGQQLLVGPWPHGLPRANMAGEVDFGYRAAPSVHRLEDRMVLNFFDRWLKGIQRRRPGGPGATVRDGTQPLARRKRVAARAHRLAALLPA